MSRRQKCAILCLIPLLAGLFFVSGCLSNQPLKESNPSISTGTLTYYTEQMPPYNYMENGTLHGISVDLLEAVTGKIGERISRDRVRLVNWTEGYQAALSQNKTVIFTTMRLPEREDSFNWVGPIYSYTNVIFARKDRAINITGPQNLTGFRIGVIVDDCAIPQLLAAGVNKSQLVYDTNVTGLIGRLESGGIDLWCYNDLAGRYFTRQVTGDAKSYAIVYTLPKMEAYYAFSKDIPDSTVQSFQKALDDMKGEKNASGGTVYDGIVQAYSPLMGLSFIAVPAG